MENEVDDKLEVTEETENLDNLEKLEQDILAEKASRQNPKLKKSPLKKQKKKKKHQQQKY